VVQYAGGCSSLLRVGNEAYRRDNGTYGLTTLMRKHVSLDGSFLDGSLASVWNASRRTESMTRAERALVKLLAANRP